MTQPATKQPATKRPAYPFTAVVGQDEMKLVLLLASIDWRLGVLLRGDKGSGKTTSARGLAALLPSPAPFINLPIGATEDRLLGGLHIERAIQGDPVLKPGLLSEAHGGVLYIDEVNLLPAHLGDALLDAAASGINVVEREGLSASHAAEFVLLGSMNPEEGSLRPQLLDRFALSVTIGAPLDPSTRQAVIERRMAFDRDPVHFTAEWSAEETKLRDRIDDARERVKSIQCSSEMLNHISTLVCERGVRSLRADLAVMRAATAYAALERDHAIQPRHIEAVLEFALAHRTRENRRPSPPPPPPPPTPRPQTKEEAPPKNETGESADRVFKPRSVEAPTLQRTNAVDTGNGSSPAADNRSGPVIGSRQSDNPKELDLRSTLTHALRETGSLELQAADIHERVRKPTAGTRYLFVIDSSGSHAARERMRSVKGAAMNLMTRSFKRGDEIAIIVFRGTSAETVLEPTANLADATTALEYLPTGGRTPLAHGLALAKSYLTPKTILIVMTDGRANFPLHGDDPWQDALAVAADLKNPTLIIDTETSDHPTGQAKILAEALQARCLSLDELAAIPDITFEISSMSK
jgi:magnesium chelatase subunit D